MYVYQMTELAIKTSERYPNRIEFIRSIHIIVNDQIGQAPAKFDNMVDNIFKVVCGMNVHKEKILLATYDPTQLQPVRVSPFMVTPLVITCYKKHSYQKFFPRTI